MRFLNFIEFINENVSYEKGCAMLYFKFPDMEKLHSEIESGDIYDEEEKFGLEDKPHCTLLYGFHDDEIKNRQDVLDSIDISFDSLELYNASLFENDDYDVLKFDVRESDDTDDDKLFAINKVLTDKFPYSTEYPDYHPHCTISYIKKGEGKKYVEKFMGKTYTVQPWKVVYSYPDKENNKDSEIEKIISDNPQ